MAESFDNSPLVRTDFSDDGAWHSLVAAATAMSREGHQADLRMIDDRRFGGCAPAELIELGRGWNDAAVLFIADTKALTNPDQPILCVDLFEEAGRSFRCIPSELCGVENNLRISNMDFDEFARFADDQGTFRGFPRGATDLLKR